MVPSQVRVVLPGPLAPLPGWSLKISGRAAALGQWLSVAPGLIQIHIGMQLTLPALALSGSLRAVVDVLPESSVTVTVPLPAGSASPRLHGPFLSSSFLHPVTPGGPLVVGDAVVEATVQVADEVVSERP